MSSLDFDPRLLAADGRQGRDILPSLILDSPGRLIVYVVGPYIHIHNTYIHGTYTYIQTYIVHTYIRVPAARLGTVGRQPDLTGERESQQPHIYPRSLTPPGLDARQATVGSMVVTDMTMRGCRGSSA